MKRLLIVRPDGIGDFVIFSAVIEGYVKLFADYSIDVLCRPETKDLAETVPFIRRVYCVDADKLFRKKYLFYTVLKIAGMRSRRYDLIIYPVYSRDKNIDKLIKYIPAREKIAFDGDDANDPKRERPRRNRYYTSIIPGEPASKPEILRNAEFLLKIGGRIDCENLKSKIWFSPRDDAEFDDIKNRYGLTAGRYIALFPGARYRIRQWKAAKWRKIIDYLLKSYPDYKIVTLGAGDDAGLIEGILAGHLSGSQMFVNLAGRTRLRVTAKVIQHAKILIGMETCAVHFAAALGTPNVCIMGGGHWGRFYPYGDMDKNCALGHRLDCYGCDWRCIYKEARCLEQIETEGVRKCIERLMRF